MKPNDAWRFILLFSLSLSQVADCQSVPKPNEISLKTVVWPGLAKVSAVCIAHDGLHVCVLPINNQQDLPDPQIYDQAGTAREARLLYKDDSSGLVLLKSHESDSHVPISSRTAFEPGRALTLPTPKGSIRIRLAGKDRYYLGKELPCPMLRFRMDSKMECAPGTPLINEVGELEGLVTSTILAEANEGHAIPAGMIRKVIDDVLKHQTSGPVWIGMVFQSDSSTPQVVEVKKNSPADKSGIKSLDIILEVNGTKISEIADLVEALKFLPGERPSRFKVLRDLDVKEFEVIPKLVEEIHSF